MEDRNDPLIRQVCGEIKKVLNEHFEIEHQLIQKDIKIATLNIELTMQKHIHALLRQSYANLLKCQSKSQAT